MTKSVAKIDGITPKIEDLIPDPALREVFRRTLIERGAPENEINRDFPEPSKPAGPAPER